MIWFTNYDILLVDDDSDSSNGDDIENVIVINKLSPPF